MTRMKLIAVATLAVVLLVTCLSCASAAPAVQNTVKWRMATSWPDDLPYISGAAKAICKRVGELSGGRLTIEYYPADKLVAPLEVFDAVSKGTVECGHSWPGYWVSKNKAFVLFSSTPNNMNLQEWMVWMYGPSRGIDMWRELYAKYNVVPFPGLMVGPEFGFFTNKPIRSIEDFKGLKLRVTGMASDVVQELGATTVLTAPGEIQSAMAKGDIDGFEFSAPAIDWQAGFQKSAKYLTLPSWHQPSAMFETIVNKNAWDKLPADLQADFEAACKEVALVDQMAYLESSNPEYLAKFEKSGMQIFVLSQGDMKKITVIADGIVDQQAAADAFYARVLKSQRDFKAGYRTWEKWGDFRLYGGE